MTAEIREHRNQEYLKFTLDVLVLLYGILRSRRRGTMSESVTGYIDHVIFRNEETDIP